MQPPSHVKVAQVKRAAVCFLAAWSLVFSRAAEAQSTDATGNGLLARVQSLKRLEGANADTVIKEMDVLDSGWLIGFTHGTATALSSARQICLPVSGTTSGQYVRVLTQYLEANPALLHLPDWALAYAAFRKAFPCREP